MLTALVAIILTLILVIGVHELGHALAAKLFGVKIQRISIGFGKPIMAWQDKQGREWVWATWPLGGYVKLLNSRFESVQVDNYPFCFDKQAPWRRIIILLAGIIANFLAALVALTIFYMIGHQEVMPVIKEVKLNSVAARAGLTPKDRFISIANWPTNSIEDVASTLIINLGKQEVEAEVEQLGQVIKKVKLNLAKNTGKNNHGLLGFLGITFDESEQYKLQVRPKGLIAAVKEACYTSYRTLIFLIFTLKQLIIQNIPFSLLLGPLGILSISAASLAHGLATFLYFIAILSLTLGLTNSLPIPSLDGGAIVFTLIEKIRGKPISVALELLLYRLVFIAFVVFAIQLVLNDLQRYFA